MPERVQRAKRTGWSPLYVQCLFCFQEGDCGERDGGHGCWGDMSIFYKIMKFAYYQKKTSRGLVTQVSGGTMTILSRAFILISMTSLLSACGSLNNIYWKNGLPGGGEIMTVDAKQRHLIMLPDAKNPAKWRVCAEAAPDVFSAVSSSAGGEALFGGANQSLKGSVAIAETAAAIGRTQTINMLRESMYRTCERYLSGAISRPSFVVQAARDQRTMVAILAIEQLTGAMRTRSTVISGPATSTVISNNEKAIELAEALRKNQERAYSEMTAAKGIFDTANGTSKCAGDAQVPAGADTAAKEAFADCDLKEKAYEEKKAEHKKAQDQLDAALKAVAESNSSVRAATQAGLNESGEKDNSEPDYAALKGLASHIENIVKSPNIDEPLMFCLSILSDEYTKVGADLHSSSAVTGAQYSGIVQTKNTCLKIISQRAAIDAVSNSGLSQAQVYNFIGENGIIEADQINTDPDTTAPDNPASTVSIADRITIERTKIGALLSERIGRTDKTELPAKMSALLAKIGEEPIDEKICINAEKCRDFAQSRGYYFTEGLSLSELEQLMEAVLEWRE